MEEKKRVRPHLLPRPQQRAMTVAKALHPTQCDPNGSYTGVPLQPDEVPVQDQDDL